MKYSEQLKDPRWQRRRLEIMDAAGWHCRVCSDSASPLHVHHIQYRKGKMAWEYEDEELLAVCEECHGRIEKVKKEVAQLITIGTGLFAVERFIIRFREAPNHLDSVLRFMPPEFAKAYSELCEKIWIASAKENGGKDVR